MGNRFDYEGRYSITGATIIDDYDTDLSGRRPIGQKDEQWFWIVTALVSVLSSVMQMVSSSQKAAAEKKAVRDEAQAVERQTELNVAQQHKENERVLAKNAARTGALGVASSSGSPLEQELSNSFTAGLNEAITKWEGDYKAYSIRQKIPIIEAENRANQWKGIGNIASSVLGAWSGGGSSALSGSGATGTAGASSTWASSVPGGTFSVGTGFSSASRYSATGFGR